MIFNTTPSTGGAAGHRLHVGSGSCVGSGFSARWSESQYGRLRAPVSLIVKAANGIDLATGEDREDGEEEACVCWGSDGAAGPGSQAVNWGEWSAFIFQVIFHFSVLKLESWNSFLFSLLSADSSLLFTGNSPRTQVVVGCNTSVWEVLTGLCFTVCCCEYLSLTIVLKHRSALDLARTLKWKNLCGVDREPLLCAHSRTQQQLGLKFYTLKRQRCDIMMLWVFQVVEMTCCCSVSAVRNENVEEKKTAVFLCTVVDCV